MEDGRAAGNRSVNHVNVEEIVDIIYRTAFSELLNIKAVAVISPFPQLANDVDKPSDIEWWEKYL